MEESIIQKLYMKILFSGIAAFIVFLLALQMSGAWHDIWIGLIIIGGFLFSFFTVRNNVKKGNVVAIYAQCYEITGRSNLFNAKRRAIKTYRFLTRSVTEDGTLSEDNELSVSLYIKAEAGKFREGEGYCLLFNKLPNNHYDEKNLITYGAVVPEIMAFRADDGVNSLGLGAIDKSINEANVLNDENVEETLPSSHFTPIYFNKKEEE